jgi:hypothetical protein
MTQASAVVPVPANTQNGSIWSWIWRAKRAEQPSSTSGRDRIVPGRVPGRPGVWHLTSGCVSGAAPATNVPAAARRPRASAPAHARRRGRRRARRRCRPSTPPLSAHARFAGRASGASLLNCGRSITAPVRAAPRQICGCSHPRRGSDGHRLPSSQSASALRTGVRSGRFATALTAESCGHGSRWLSRTGGGNGPSSTGRPRTGRSRRGALSTTRTGIR